MLYFATASGPKVRDAMLKGLLGQICTPASGNRVLGVRWCADNGVFGGTYPGDDKYLKWLADRMWAVDRCAFAVAPDVVCDAQATLDRFALMGSRIRALGYPVALAGQNGLEDLTVPWSDLDALFLGGDDPWKLGAAAAALAAEARARGKWVHMGRVNSGLRLRYAAFIGCDSVDGTYLKWPDTNLPKLLGYLRAVNHPALWNPADLESTA